ncbi:uncharacterized protein FYW23_006304 isoform 1-T12 [Sylvia borin]
MATLGCAVRLCCHLVDREGYCSYPPCPSPRRGRNARAPGASTRLPARYIYHGASWALFSAASPGARVRAVGSAARRASGSRACADGQRQRRLSLSRSCAAADVLGVTAVPCRAPVPYRTSAPLPAAPTHHPRLPPARGIGGKHKSIGGEQLAELPRSIPLPQSAAASQEDATALCRKAERR